MITLFDGVLVRAIEGEHILIHDIKITRNVSRHKRECQDSRKCVMHLIKEEEDFCQFCFGVRLAPVSAVIDIWSLPAATSVVFTMHVEA